MPNVPNRAELGLLYPIFLVDYDPNWPALFEQEKKRLLTILGTPTILRTEHIGSTAIPGMKAKPTVDILIELSPRASAEDIHDRMVAQRYIRMVEEEKHIMFVRGYGPEGLEKESFHIHMYPQGHSKIVDSLQFRDYLRQHPPSAREYEALKEELALRFRNDREAYTEGKTAFVERVLAGCAELRYVPGCFKDALQNGPSLKEFD